MSIRSRRFSAEFRSSAENSAARSLCSKIVHDFFRPIGYNELRYLSTSSWEVLNLRKLNAAVDRFAYSHPRFGIPNLMKFLVGVMAVVFVLDLFL